MEWMESYSQNRREKDYSEKGLEYKEQQDREDECGKTKKSKLDGSMRHRQKAIRLDPFDYTIYTSPFSEWQVENYLYFSIILEAR